jgi:MFS family permease
LKSRIFTAFESRDFRLMWAGACTSSIGTWMQKLAQSWLVFQLSGSAFMLGLDSFLGEIPIFLLALYAGVVADRMDRRRLLIASQMLQMSCAFTLATLFALGRAEVWHILSLSFVVGTAQAFGAPAYQSLLPSLVPREHLPNAIAMNSIQFNVARLVGPAVGGLTLSTLGAAWCFGLNGLSYVAVIAPCC